MPKRIQRKRVAGFKMPKRAFYVGRPTKWGNPFKVGSEFEDVDGMVCEVRDVAHSLECYRHWVQQVFGLEEIQRVLGGRDLACWCPLVDENGNKVPCHADVLLELANQ